MGFICCICHEDMTRKEKKIDSNDPDNKKVHEKPIVTTKCGHIFHSQCLKDWFEKKGPNAWATKECPTCRMSLTVATDLIRIFPSSSDDESPTLDDYKRHISKLQSDRDVLSNNLEMSFLRGRDQEKKINQMARDLEKIQRAYILEKSKVSQFQSEAAKLKNENEELRNVIINLNKAMTSGHNGIHLPYSGFNSNDGKQQLVQQFPLQYSSQLQQQQHQQQPIISPPNVGVYHSNGTNNVLPTATTNTSGYLDDSNNMIMTMQSNNNDNNNNNNHAILGQHQQLQQGISWPPPQIKSNNNNNNNNTPCNGSQIMTGSNVVVNMNENPVAPIYMLNNNSNNIHSQTGTNDVSQLNAMFQGIMGLPSSGASILTTLYGDRDGKSSILDENSSSSCLDSDSSRTDSETGDHHHHNNSIIRNNNNINNNNAAMTTIFSVNNNSIDDNNSNPTNINNYMASNVGIGLSNKNKPVTIGESTSSSSSSTKTQGIAGPSNNFQPLPLTTSTGTNITSKNGFPSDELLDEILNSKSAKSTHVTCDDFNLIQKKSASKIQKGKTKWKAYEYEDDKKMYGKFSCKNCSAKWGTSRHVFNQSQTCLKCNETVFPYDQGPVMSKEELAQQKKNWLNNKN